MVRHETSHKYIVLRIHLLEYVVCPIYMLIRVMYSNGGAAYLILFFFLYQGTIYVHKGVTEVTKNLKQIMKLRHKCRHSRALSYDDIMIKIFFVLLVTHTFLFLSFEV